MPDINRPPVGFNQLLQLQTKGQNPNELNQTVQPTIDYEKFIRTNLELSIKNQNFVIDTTFDQAVIAASEITVPDGQLWYVLSVAMRANQTYTAGVIQGGLCIVRTTATNQDIPLTWQYHVGSGIDWFGDSYTFPEPFVAVPGTTFGYYCGITTLAAPGPNFRMRVLHYKYADTARL